MVVEERQRTISSADLPEKSFFVPNVGLYEDMEGKFVCLCQKIVLKNFVVRL
jgi:hypothetical protein